MAEIRLIDANALKEALMNTQTSLKYMGVFTVNDIKEFIDNAPTIPQPDFKDGYKQAIIDGKTNFIIRDCSEENKQEVI